MTKPQYVAPPFLSYRQAAAHVGRSVRAIHRWRRNGMPMTWRMKDGQKIRVVRRDILEKWYRERLKNDPAHQYRLRKLRASDRIETAPQVLEHPGA